MLSGNAQAWADHFRLSAVELRCFLLGLVEALGACMAWGLYLCWPTFALALLGEALVLAAAVALARAWWCNRKLKQLEGKL